MTLQRWAEEWRRERFRPWQIEQGAPSCEGARIAEDDPPPLPMTCPECGYLADIVGFDGRTPEGRPIWRIFSHPRADW